MRELTYQPKVRTTAESAAIFTICVLGSILLGWLAVYLSGALTPAALPTPVPDAFSRFLTPSGWTAVFILMGVALYFLLTVQVYTRTRQLVRNWSAALWCLVYIALGVWLFVFYGLSAYMTSFITMSLIASACAALLVLAFRLKLTAGLLLSPVLAWTGYLVYASLYAILYA